MEWGGSSCIDTSNVGGGGAQTVSIYDNIVNDCDYYGIGAGDEAVDDNISIYDNVIKNAKYPIAVRAIGTYNVFNNTISGTGTDAFEFTSTGTKNIHAKNNILSGTFNYIINFTSSGSVLDMDHNIYYGGTTSLAKINSIEKTFATWKSSTSQDAHSQNSEPLFVSSSDFHLQSTSPAINAGTNVGLTTDFDGNPKSGANWDIGAYEFQDSTAPTTTADIATGLYNTPQTVTLTCSDSAGVGCDKTYYTLDNSTPTTGSLVYSTALNISATTTLKYFSQDKNGNSESVSTKTYTIDTQAPTGGAFTINSGATSTNLTSATLNITCPTDPWTPIQVAFGNSAAPTNWTACTASKALTLPTGDGTKNVYVRFKDGGNNTTSDLTQSIILDQTASTTSVNPAGGTYGAARDITLTCDDGTGSGCDKIYYTTNGVDPTTSSSYYQSTPINIATNTTLKFFAKDLAGNSETIKTENYVIDPTVPVTDIITMPNPISNVNSANFEFSSNKAGSTFECKLDSASFASCTTPKSYTSLTEGSHTFQVRATDTLGHVEPTPATYTWTIDTIAPNTSITAEPANPTDQISATFAFTSNESNSAFECKLDSGSFASCASSKTYTALVDGSHTFQVRATDQADNVDQTPATYTWTIDTVLPLLDIMAPNVNAKVKGDEVIAFTDTKLTSPKCSLDNATWTDCVSSATKISDIANWNTLPEGGFNLYLKETDTAGNSATISEALIKDIAAPTISNLNPNKQTFSVTTTSTNLSLNTSENATCKYATTPNTDFNSMTIFDNTNSTSHSTFIGGLAPGVNYTYYVKCADVAGNVTADSLSTFSVAPVENTASILGKIEVKLNRTVNKFKDTIYIAKTKFKLTQRDAKLTNGTVKIYKGNKLWKTVAVDASGAWSQTLKLANNTREKIKLFFYDRFGTLLGKSRAEVRIDTEKPQLTLAPVFIKHRGSVITWQATDNGKIDHYEIKLNGIRARTTKQVFTIPSNAQKGIQTLTVTAVDRAGNKTSRTAWLTVTW